MINTDILIIGGGPAGLCAAISAADADARVLILERNPQIGGQLIKQTHMFFGSEKQFASTRGIDIAQILKQRVLDHPNIDIMTDTTAIGMYDDNIVTAVFREERYFKIQPKAIIVATGASEKPLAFVNNDLPGIYGAGAVQTLMNVYGVHPGKKVLMVGAGNIGLIVSYQLMQAGVEVVAVLDAAPRIGGYLVHAAKIARMGVEILTSHTIKAAHGTNSVESVTVCRVDDKFAPIPDTERTFDVDTVCVSVGLSPLCELLAMRGCKMRHIPQLSGWVPLRDDKHQTSAPGVFVAGDASGIEEASSAMVEGYMTGLSAAESIGCRHRDHDALYADYSAQLDALRSGPVGEHILSGERLAKL